MDKLGSYCYISLSMTHDTICNTFLKRCYSQPAISTYASKVYQRRNLEKHSSSKTCSFSQATASNEDYIYSFILPCIFNIKTSKTSKIFIVRIRKGSFVVSLLCFWLYIFNWMRNTAFISAIISSSNFVNDDDWVELVTY